MAIINNKIANEFYKDSIIPKIIKKGSKIKVKHYLSFEPITRAVAGVEGNKILIDLMDKNPINTILTGDSVVCIFVEGELEYILNGEVVDITLFSPQKMTIKVENIEKYTNKRRQPRYSVSLSANVKPLDGKDISFAVVKNISLLGVSFVCKKELNENQEIVINIAISNNTIITFYGRIIRKRQMQNFFEYGVSQTSIDEINKEELEKYIKLLEEEEERFFMNEAAE